MKTTSIKGELTKFIKKSMGSENPRFSGWYCGITNNEERRKAQHNYNRGKIKYWKCINAGTMKNANEVERYFSEKGTANLPGPNGAKISSRWVYIFKLPTTKQMGLGGVLEPQSLYEQVFGN